MNSYRATHVGFVGGLDLVSESESHLELAGRIAYYSTKKNEKLIQSPLQNLHKLGLGKSDKLEMLAFGYASLFTLFMGNITRGRRWHRGGTYYPYVEYITTRFAVIMDTVQEDYD